MRKKDVSLRMCVDYRCISSKTLKCNYPVSRLEDLFERVKGCKVFLCYGFEGDILSYTFKTRRHA